MSEEDVRVTMTVRGATHRLTVSIRPSLRTVEDVIRHAEGVAKVLDPLWRYHSVEKWDPKLTEWRRVTATDDRVDPGASYTVLHLPRDTDLAMSLFTATDVNQ